MSDPETDSRNVHALPANENRAILPGVEPPAAPIFAAQAAERKDYAGIPGLGAPPTNEMHKWTNFLLDQREKALRVGHYKRAERLLNAAWEAYFRGR